MMLKKQNGQTQTNTTTQRRERERAKRVKSGEVRDMLMKRRAAGGCRRPMQGRAPAMYERTTGKEKIKIKK